MHDARAKELEGLSGVSSRVLALGSCCSRVRGSSKLDRVNRFVEEMKEGHCEGALSEPQQEGQRSNFIAGEEPASRQHHLERAWA